MLTSQIYVNSNIKTLFINCDLILHKIKTAIIILEQLSLSNKKQAVTM